MSRETEKFFREFENYIRGKDIEDEKELEKLLNEFVLKANTSSLPKKQNDPWEYLELAYNTDNEEDALKYCKKALKIDKNCLDAEILMIQLTAEDGEDAKRKYEKLLKKAEKHLKDEGVFVDENIGHFWGIVGTRPYMRLKYSYADLLIKQGKYKKAIAECENLLVLSENDNLGVRYLLLSLYALFEDEKNTINLYKKYEEEQSVQMLLPIVALYYKLDDYKKAEIYLEKLNKANPKVKEVFQAINSLPDFGELEPINFNGYRLGSKEEVLTALDTCFFLYSTTAGLVPWILSKAN
ncbi:MAG TPA: hypothetical protein GX522_08455 [Firmicutes bacterium]|nr:hypothetical protein [Bacillota bacterium]